MENRLSAPAIIVIMVASLVFTLESNSFAFRNRDRDMRKITIVNPLGGEKYLAGSTQKISWQSSRSIRFVKIEYSIDNGKNWIEIVKSMKMDEPFASYQWKVPCTDTSEAKIRVSDVYGPDYDVIINSFSILCENESGRENGNDAS